MPAPNAGPAAFLSYAHDDDELGEISRFRARLEFEIKRHLGRPFPIFFDRKDLGWGQQWKRSIQGALGEATFLIPVLTPSFFSSTECRDEVETFRRRERELGRDDLILPVYFIETPQMDDPAVLAGDPLAVVLAGYQYADWRELRHDVRLESSSVSIAMAELARRVRDAVRRVETDNSVRPPAPAATRADPTLGPDRAGTKGREEVRPEGREEPPRPLGGPVPPAAAANPAQHQTEFPRPFPPTVARVEQRATVPAPRRTPEFRVEGPVSGRGAAAADAPARGAALRSRALGRSGGLTLGAAVLVLATVAAFRSTPVFESPLLHLWALPPVDARLFCPPPVSGEPVDVSGAFEPGRLAAMWAMIAAVTTAGVVLLVAGCYQLPRNSLSARFVGRWYGWLAGAALFSALVPPAVAVLMPARALAGSCMTNPAAFSVYLPLDLVLPRAAAGALWGMAAFLAVSLVATRLLGRGPWAGGFFHYRGCPWPRWSPWGR